METEKTTIDELFDTLIPDVGGACAEIKAALRRFTLERLREHVRDGLAKGHHTISRVGASRAAHVIQIARDEILRHLLMEMRLSGPTSTIVEDALEVFVSGVIAAEFYTSEQELLAQVQALEERHASLLSTLQRALAEDAEEREAFVHVPLVRVTPSEQAKSADHGGLNLGTFAAMPPRREFEVVPGKALVWGAERLLREFSGHSPDAPIAEVIEALKARIHLERTGIGSVRDHVAREHTIEEIELALRAYVEALDVARAT